MKAIFSNCDFQNWSGITHSLNLVNLSQSEDVIQNKIPITTELSNFYAKKNGIETVLFKSANMDNFKINFDYTIKVPEIYESAFPQSAYFSAIKMLAMASMKEPFIFIGNYVMLKDENFIKNRVLAGDDDFIFSYRQAFPFAKLNKKFVDFWDPLNPVSFDAKTMNGSKSYDMSLFVCRNNTLVNRVAKEICEFLIEKKDVIDKLYQSQALSPREVYFNPSLPHLIESIWFPNILMHESKKYSVLCPEEITQKAFGKLAGNFTPALHHNISEAKVEINNYFNETLNILIDGVIPYTKWIADIYEPHSKIDFNKIIL